MTTKKAKTIKQRAAAIIANAKRYNADTRAAISRALDEGHADLAECVKRAERGETILDISTAPAKSLGDHQEAELAALIAAVIAHPFTPSRIYNVLVDELTDMFVEVPSGESADTPEFIERVLNWHQGFGFRNVSRKESTR